MKSINTIIMLSAMLLFGTGCDALLNNNNGILGKASKQSDKANTAIIKTDDKLAEFNDNKLTLIGAYSKGGVEYALDKDTNNSVEVNAAKQMNERIETLANEPNLDKVKIIETIVDEMLSQNKAISAAGEKALSQKDKEIENIQNNANQLLSDKNKQMTEIMQQYMATAQKADQYNATLSTMNSYGGIGAIWYGVKHLATRLAWFLGIGSVLFIILRLLSTTNPIASAIFSVVDSIFSLMVRAIAKLAPKALTLAGNTATSVYNEAKSALSSVVDSIETIKLQSNTSGKPATIQDLLNTAEISMTPADKQTIENIKIELGWIKPSTQSTVINNSK